MNAKVLIKPTPSFATTVFFLFLFITIPPSTHCFERRRPRKSIGGGDAMEIVWSASTPMFGNASSISENAIKPASIAVHPGQSVTFSCPTGDRNERLVVSAVSEMSLIECQLDSASTPFLICDDQRRRRKKLIQSGESPSGTANNAKNTANLEPESVFYSQPGSVQYFISTSNGTSADGLWNSRGGLCASRNLRLRVEFNEGSGGSENSETATHHPLEYSIEEMPPVARYPPDAEDGQRADISTGSNRNKVAESEEQMRGDPRNRLAKSLSIKPEYLEFVRNHAIRGGTGDIRFPPTDEDARDEHVKWPRFVSRNSDNPWRRSRPPLLAPSMPLRPASSMDEEDGERRHANNEWQISRNRQKSTTRSFDSSTPPFSRDQLIWTSNLAYSLQRPQFFCVIFAFIIFYFFN